MQGYTQEELAKALGMSQVSYSRKEKQAREFTLSEVVGVIRELKLTAHEADIIFFGNQLTRNEATSKGIIRLVG